MATILLISLKTLKEEYGFDENIDDAYVLPLIKKGQDFLIKPSLGETLYNEIISGISSGNLSATYRSLVEGYIQPVLAYYVLSEVMYSTAYKVKNTAPETDRFDEYVKISSKYKNDYQHYLQIMKEYICDTAAIQYKDEVKRVIKTGLYLD